MKGLIGKILGGGSARVTPESLPDRGEMPEFRGISVWLNSKPLSRETLKGKVVLVDFWTLSCVNCVRTLPHLKAWHERYRDSGLVIVGVHTPEFGFERERAAVEAAVRRFDIAYPVALDDDYETWKAYRNHYWPAHYFVDRTGRVRYHHFGEGGYAHSEAVLRSLLSEDGTPLPDATDTEDRTETDFDKIGTPETYLGYERLEYLGSPEPVNPRGVARYSPVMRPAANVFYLDGDWEISREWAAPRSENAALIYRFQASRVNLVMDADGEARTVLIELDGGPLKDDELGADAERDEDTTVIKVNEGRMYELVDARGKYGEHGLRLTFPEPGVRLYAFTFG